METIIGYISGILVLLSGFIYLIRVYQRKITPNIITWSIWSIMGVAILLSYKSSGAEQNIWPAVSGAINPFLVLLISLFRKRDFSFTFVDVVCGILGVVSIVFWYKTKSNHELVRYALYLALIADVIAIIPTIFWVAKNPEKDRPAMWFVFSFGYALAIFAIQKNTFSNYLLPIWMVVMPFPVWYFLVRYRIKNKVPLREWI